MWVLITAFIALVAPATSEWGNAAPSPVPDWLQEEMARLTHGSGRWLADNSDRVSEGEPWDHYGMQWTWGLGRQTVEGRLYAVKDGKETGAIWEYRLFWHPGESRAYLQQFGTDGSFASGTLKPDSAGGTMLDQTLYSPDGTAARIGHQARFEGDVRMTRSLGWVSGAWEPRREYRWRRLP